MSQCSITFHNNPQAVFYGGQLLSGTAVLTTVKQKTIRAIHIEINGRAQVRWEESRTRSDNHGKSETYIEYYYGNERYLDSRAYVAGESGGDSFELMPRRYRYDFRLKLPMELPSSIEGTYGNIRYEVRVTIDRPWKFNNIFKKMFTVIQTLNLNFDPIYKQPIIKEDIKELCCRCCGNEYIKVTCRIPFSGYAPGQKIPFSVRVDNNSTGECHRSLIKLEKTIRYTSQKPEQKSRYETQRMTQKQLGSITQSSYKKFNDFLPIPPIPPSSVNSHDIIEAHYMIIVKVIASGLQNSATFSFPIKIGTVPLLESAINHPSVVTVQPTSPKLLSQDGDSPPPYFLNAPPSYEEALKNQETLADDDDKTIISEPYAPKYPVYYNFTTPTEPIAEPVFPSASTDLSGPSSTSASHETSELLPTPKDDAPGISEYGRKIPK